MEATITATPTTSNIEANKRIGYVDIAKFLAILFVVTYHIGSTSINLGVDFPVTEGFSFFWKASLNNFFQFVVPFFFFVMGITYVYGKYTYKQYVKNKLYTLIIPFILIYIFSAIFNSLMTSIPNGLNFFNVFAGNLIGLLWGSFYLPFEIPALGIIRSTDPTTLAYGRIAVTIGPLMILYFLQALIPASLLFMPLVELLKKDKYKHYHIYRGLTIIALLLLVGIEPFLCKDWSLPFALGYVPFFLLIMLMGSWLKELKLFDTKGFWKNALIFIIGAGLLVFGGGFTGGPIFFVINKYGGNWYLGILLTYINVVGGSICFIQIARSIELIKIKQIPNFCRWIGQRTLPIYSLHFLIAMPCLFALMAMYGITFDAFITNPEILNKLTPYIPLVIVISISLSLLIGIPLLKFFMFISLKIKGLFDKLALAREVKKHGSAAEQ